MIFRSTRPGAPAPMFALWPIEVARHSDSTRSYLWLERYTREVEEVPHSRMAAIVTTRRASTGETFSFVDPTFWSSDDIS